MRVLGRDPAALLKATWHGMSEDKVSVYAAQMAYSFFFALFPLLLFCAALLTLVADKRTVMGWLDGQVTATLPAGVSDLLRTTVERVIFAKGAPGILSFGLITAAWSGSSIFGAFRQALNDAYEVEEHRPWWKQYALQLGALVVAGVVLLVATIVLLNGDGIMRWLGSHFGLGPVTTLVWSIVQFPLAIAAVVVLLWVLYLYLPDCRRQNPRYVLVGAITATVLWIVATLLFRIYVQKFNALNPAYGAIGAIMVLLTWMYYSSYVLLAAGELSSQLERGAGGETTARTDGGSDSSSRMDAGGGRSGQTRPRPAAVTPSPEVSVPASDGHRGFAALLRQLVTDAALVVRRELSLFRLELGAIVRDIGVGALLVAAGVVAGLLGVLAIVAGSVLLIGDQWLPADLYWVAALIVTVISGVGAYAFLRRGRGLVTRASLAPTETIETLEEDARWTRDQLTSSGKSA